MKRRRNALIRWAGRAAVFVGFAAGVVVLILWLAGKFSPKVPVSTAQAEPSKVEGRTVPARPVRVPRVETAVGTIRAVHEISIGSKLQARVVKVDLKAGQKVKAGDVLVRLDDKDLQAKLDQAQAAVDLAEAVQTQAAADEKRDAGLVQTNAVSRQQYESAVTALKSATAQLRRAKAAAEEAQIMLQWATITSPIDGTVIDKKIQAGDMVNAGQVLLTLFDPKRMQLIASVRESLGRRLEPGDPIDVQLDALKKTCTGTISEVVPEAQSASRAFQVKVTGPCPPGAYSGMFGRVLIPLDETEEVLAIPKEARIVVGQLELADVVDASGRVSRRAVRTGRVVPKHEDLLEVLSGLREGEKVLVPARGPSHD